MERTDSRSGGSNTHAHTHVSLFYAGKAVEVIMEMMKNQKKKMMMKIKRRAKTHVKAFRSSQVS